MVEKTDAGCFECLFVEVYDCVTAGRVVWDKFSRIVAVCCDPELSIGVCET